MLSKNKFWNKNILQYVYCVNMEEKNPKKNLDGKMKTDQIKTKINSYVRKKPKKSIKLKLNKIKFNKCVIAFVILFLLLIGSLLTNGFGLKNIAFGESPDKIAKAAINYINGNLLAKGMTASLVESSKEKNGLYKVKFKIGGQEYDSYVSGDGKILFPQGIEMEEKQETSQNQSQEQANQDVPKKEKPDVKLFIMSYCPFGLQAEKMYLPVYDLLGDKADMGIYFVSYIMHDKKEIDENLRQYCIQEKQKEKYYNYLNCFVKDDNFEKCLTEAKIDKTKLDKCISETDAAYKITEAYNDKESWLNGQFPKFDIHADLNEKYEVGGSPTVVINDKVVSVNPRSPEKFKESICDAFNEAPNECSQALSDEAASSGFGDSGLSSGGSCK